MSLQDTTPALTASRSWLRWQRCYVVVACTALAFSAWWGLHTVPVHKEVAAPITLPARTVLDATVRAGDTLSTLFQRYHLRQQDVAAIERLPHAADILHHLQPGQAVQLRTQPHTSHVLSVSTVVSNHRRWVAEFDGGVYRAKFQPFALHWHDEVRSVAVQHSLFQEGQQAGVPASVLLSIGRLLKSQGRAGVLHPGDHVMVILRHYNSTGGRRPAPKLLALRWWHGLAAPHTALRFEDASGHVGFFDALGHALAARFLRAPLHYRRVSSIFTPARLHPILHQRRPHKGVDLAAPMNTPIWSTSDGRVTFVGRLRGYGRVVKVQHPGSLETRYAHMHRFAKGLHVGQRVHAHQVIGYVGQSGWATGPHCHYEVRRHGRAVDPFHAHLPRAVALSKADQAALHAQWVALRPLWARGGATQTLRV